MSRSLLCFSLALAACAPIGTDDVMIGPDAAFSPDGTVPPDSATFVVDASADAFDGGKFNGGGPFLCAGCVCDGTQDMCWSSAVWDAGDAAACASDAGYEDWCGAIPIQCLPNPTCACIAPLTGCKCGVSADGNGYVLTCPPKP